MADHAAISEAVVELSTKGLSLVSLSCQLVTIRLMITCVDAFRWNAARETTR